MDKADTFWKQFQKNSELYYQVGSIDEVKKELLMEEILFILHAYCNKLSFEIGEFPDNAIRELIISAGGRKEYFNKAKELVRIAPRIEKWQFRALIPPKDLDFTMNYEGNILNINEIWFVPLSNEKQPQSVSRN